MRVELANRDGHGGFLKMAFSSSLKGGYPLNLFEKKATRR
jgi:hypothetical protein